MESKKCHYCGSTNPINAHFCRTCGSLFVDSSFSDDEIDNARFIKQTEEIIQLRNVLETLSKDNSLLTIRYNNTHDKNILLSKEIKDKNFKLSNISKEKLSLINTIRKDKKKIKDLTKTKRNLHVIYISFCFFLLIIFTCLFILSSSKTKQFEVAPQILSSIATIKPIICGSINVRNAGENYNSTIISKETTYINPQIELISLIEGNVVLYVKFYTPNGLSKGDSRIKVPEDYSYADSISLVKNKLLFYELSGWGNETKGNWSAGNYKIEIYYKNELLGVKEFTIQDNYVEFYEK